jgi:sugar (glycoside-pentoside-hexuronide) transporter
VDTRERLGFAVAGFGQNLIYNWVALYLLAYLYDGAGLSTNGIATLTVILSACKVWDAISDLLVGLLVDRTRTRWGTFRIYPLITAVPIAALTAWLFHVPAGSETRKLVVIGLAYVLWSVVFTTSDVPYWSLTNVITTDDESRSRLVGWARTAAMLGLAVVTLVGAPLAVALSGGGTKATGTGWGRATLVVASIGMALFTLAFFVTTERVRHRPHPLPFRAALRQFTANRPLFLILISGVLCFGQLMIQVGGAVVAAVVFGDVRYFTVLGAALIGGMLVATLATPRLLRHTTRREFMRRILIGLSLSYVLLYAVGYASVARVAAAIAVNGLFLGAYTVTQTMMIGDTANYVEALTGDRIDGACFAGLTFVTKLNSALATMVFGLVVAWVGYQSDGFVTGSMRSGIWLALTVLPAVSALLGLLPLRWYAVPERDLPALLAARRGSVDAVAVE